MSGAGWSKFVGQILRIRIVRGQERTEERQNDDCEDGTSDEQRQWAYELEAKTAETLMDGDDVGLCLLLAHTLGGELCAAFTHR
jgi:hypothetical protein